ncbi:MAG: hypothetical protein ACR2MX_10155 [Cyclobacteriaceae bacterium]
METIATKHTFEQQREMQLQALKENLRQSNLEAQSDEEREALRSFLRDFAVEQVSFDTDINFELPQAS